MAIDKSNTKPWVKVVIIVVALSFVAAFIPGLWTALSGSGQQNSATGGNGQLEQVAKQHAGQIASLKGLLASDPTSYTVLVAMGNAYFDWAAATAQASTDSGIEGPMWESATIYYERALAAKSGDPSVGTDMAIAYFYGGRTAEAIAAVEVVLAKNPEFAAGLYNAGIFYQAAGRNADGVAVLTKYIAADPQGTSGQIDRAKQMITQMQGSAGSPSPGLSSTLTTP
ncbi:MAG: hypothetical protein C0418_04945 [Coriobacteriaceae bacterium]|nr:hypothetical protein [Coriobacteriaceae bacterium]